MIPHADLPRRGRRRPFMARSIGRIVPEAQPVDWFDATTPGLALRVSPGGARTWYAFYRKGRTTRRVKLGSWPALALARARILARQTRVRVETDGADPAHERREARDVFTVGDLAKLYIEQHAKAHKTTWKDDQWRLDRYVLPAWKSRPVGEITRADVHALLDQITGDGKPIQANRVQALVSKLWNVAIDCGHVSVNPCYRMAKPAPERTRATVLDDDALRALWRALAAHPGRRSRRGAAPAPDRPARRRSPHDHLGRRGSRRGRVDDPGRSGEERSRQSRPVVGAGESHPRDPLEATRCRRAARVSGALSSARRSARTGGDPQRGLSLARSAPDGRDATRGTRRRRRNDLARLESRAARRDGNGLQPTPIRRREAARARHVGRDTRGDRTAPTVTRRRARKRRVA